MYTSFNNIYGLRPIFHAFLLLFFPIFMFAQTPVVKGIVTNEREELLIGASVFWKDTKQGMVTDTNGRFELPAREKPAILIVNYAGSSATEVPVAPEENNLWIEVVGAQLQAVDVTAKGFDTHISTLDPRNVESIGSKELRKAPCCNLSESFQTTGAIDVTYPNALTGVKEIQLLGLRGVYSQFLVENRPTMTGIAAPFAFEYIPGSWLSGIVLAKGASTVKNGNSGVSGQVNVDLQKPYLDKPFFINGFSSSEGRGELNLHLNNKGKKYISNGLYLHGSVVENNWDLNHDRFKDAANRRQVNALYRTMYEGPSGCAQLNVQALSDRRQSGQLRLWPGQEERFGIDQQNDRLEAWGKFGKEKLLGRRFLEWGNMASASWHRTNSQFGKNNYQAEQQSVFVQTLLQNIISTTDHKIVVAPSLQYDDIREQVNDTKLDRRETVAGLMGEYTYSRSSLRIEVPRFVMVLGARMDWNSRFGWQFTPRMSTKYNFTEDRILRISAGRGFRSPHLAAENISFLASNRPFDLSPARTAGPEEAWNYGVNYAENFKVAGRAASASVDLYRTDFVRQIFVDAEQEQIRIVSTEGRSFSNSLLFNFQYNLFKGFDVKFAYKWNNVRGTFSDGQVKQMPFVARQRGLVSLDYTTPQKKWSFNTYVQIIGPQRLPDLSWTPEALTEDFPAVSPTFPLLNAQATRHWRKVEIYVGCENITGFQQHHAVVSERDPWSPYFNGAQVWAPMMRQVVYAGVRYVPGGL
jgi:outer membrane receptor for ferrienterochelin and colicins